MPHQGCRCIFFRRVVTVALTLLYRNPWADLQNTSGAVVRDALRKSVSTYILFSFFLRTLLFHFMSCFFFCFCCLVGLISCSINRPDHLLFSAVHSKAPKVHSSRPSAAQSDPIVSPTWPSLTLLARTTTPPYHRAHNNNKHNHHTQTNSCNSSCYSSPFLPSSSLTLLHSTCATRLQHIKP